MAVNLGDAESEFRAKVAETLDAALELRNDQPGRQGDYPEFETGPQRTLISDAGLIAPHWPKPWGLDAGPLRQLIIDDEFAKRPALVRPSLGIAEWILPSVIRAAPKDLQEKLIPPTLRGEIAWCQLFSEPGAGSDLAALSTRATKVDGGWTINGHKIWTSAAHRADYGALLARTDPQAGKHRGIGYFVVDMRSAGIEVQPIKTATGDAHFNEVFLTDVFVPDDMLLGEPTGAGTSQSPPWPKNARPSAVTSSSTARPHCAGWRPNRGRTATTRCASSAGWTPTPTRSRRWECARPSGCSTARRPGRRPALPRWR